MSHVSLPIPLFSVSEIKEFSAQCRRGRFISSRFIAEAKHRVVKKTEFHALPNMLLSDEVDVGSRPFGKEILVAKIYGIQQGIAVLSLDDRIPYHAHLSGFLSACESTGDECVSFVETYFIPRVPGTTDNCRVSFSWCLTDATPVQLMIDGCGVSKKLRFSGERAEKLKAFLQYFLGTPP